jgi:hypothetical protein
LLSVLPDVPEHDIVQAANKNSEGRMKYFR